MDKAFCSAFQVVRDWHQIIICATQHSTSLPLLLLLAPAALNKKLGLHFSSISHSRTQSNSKHLHRHLHLVDQRLSSYSRMSSVRFAVTSEIMLVKVALEESNKSELFYSSEDCRRFEEQRIKDGRNLGRMLSEPKAHQHVSNEDMYNCIGCEKFMSLDRARRVVRNRRRHANLIVTSQDGTSPDELANISRKSTDHARGLAQRLAKSYHKNLL